ncbi:hypothetical protein [Pseudomonas sp. EL_65y_Pfl1_R32]|uniref:hypothetical protein n=1 Tax=Pseudomonas sp. EL_65y_Pfl1_R32 TaxID=3088696 RepID=UPI0030DBE3A1
MPLIQIEQDSPEVIDSARILIAAMAEEVCKILTRGNEAAQIDKTRETAAVSGHLNAMQLHGLLSMDTYGDLIAEKVAAVRAAEAAVKG